VPAEQITARKNREAHSQNVSVILVSSLHAGSLKLNMVALCKGIIGRYMLTENKVPKLIGPDIDVKELIGDGILKIAFSVRMEVGQTQITKFSLKSMTYIS
jgi:hypothetical protein